MSGGRRRLRREGYGISPTRGSKLSASSTSGSSTSSSTEGWFSVSPLEGASGGEPISIAFSLGSELKTSSSPLVPSPTVLFPPLIGIEVFFLSRGRLLLTRIPITCPKALTPLSVLPHLLYSVPSQLTSPGANGCVSFGKISLALLSAFHSSSSIVGSWVVWPQWCSNALYLFPKYASLRAISRVEYFEGSKTRSVRGFFQDFLGFATGVRSLGWRLCEG